MIYERAHGGETLLPSFFGWIRLYKRDSRDHSSSVRSELCADGGGALNFYRVASDPRDRAAVVLVPTLYSSRSFPNHERLCGTLQGPGDRDGAKRDHLAMRLPSRLRGGSNLEPMDNLRAPLFLDAMERRFTTTRDRAAPRARGAVSATGRLLAEGILTILRYLVSPIYKILVQDPIDTCVFWLSLFAIFWGLLVLDPNTNALGASASFEYMRRIGNETFWGWLTVGMGSTKLLFLLYIRRPAFRFLTSFVLFIGWGYLATAIWQETGLSPSTGAIIYGGFALEGFWIVLRRLGTWILQRRISELLANDG